VRLLLCCAAGLVLPAIISMLVTMVMSRQGSCTAVVAWSYGTKVRAAVLIDYYSNISLFWQRRLRQHGTSRHL
jgi:hypothetical protein